MKTKPIPLAVSATLLLLSLFTAQGASINIVGYVNVGFQPGDTWFNNPLQTGNNSVSGLIPAAPIGTSISLWNPASSSWGPTATFQSGTGWDNNFTLAPGTGARLETSTAFTNTFVGAVLDLNGSVSGNIPGPPPPPFAGPTGTYLLGSKCPMVLPGSGYDVFTAVVGREPIEGEAFTWLDPNTHIPDTTTFIGGAWDHGEPALAVAQAAMFSLIQVPEPSCVCLLLAGVAISWSIRKK